MSKDESNPRSNLVKLRKEKKLTQKAFASALGVTEQTVRNWEQGKAVPRLTVPQMKALCRLVEKPIEEIPDNFGEEPGGDD